MRRLLTTLLVALVGDLFLLAWLVGTIGFLPVLVVATVTAVMGFQVARAQGLAVFQRWLDDTARGDTPEEGLADGLLVLLGGVLLVSPGVLGDVAGLVLLVPPIRKRIAGRIRRRADGWVAAGGVEVMTLETAPERGEISFRRGDEPRPQRHVIDTVGEVIDTDGEVVETRPERLLGP